MTMQDMATVSGAILSLDRLEIAPTSWSQSASTHGQLSNLGAMRQLRAIFEASGGQEAGNRDLYVPQAEYKVGYNKACTSPRTLGRFCRQRGDTSIDVVIEWKNYLVNDRGSKQLAVSRSECIANLLAAPNKPEAFRLLDCVGWFLEESKDRCGLMFRVPAKALPAQQSTAQPLRLASLAQLIQQTKTRPCLADRVQLAFLLSYSMLQLHLAKWLHKSFTSSNITFFGLADPGETTSWLQRIDLTQPYIGSLGTARPDAPFEQSEPACAASMQGIEYQHPVYLAGLAAAQLATRSTQQQGSRCVLQSRYHRAFDVYGLGCVLLEIFTWKPLPSLGWRKEFETSPKDWQAHLKKVAEKNIPFMAGPVVTEIILRCLDVSGSPDEVDDLEAFCWDVIEKLDQVKV